MTPDDQHDDTPHDDDAGRRAALADKWSDPQAWFDPFTIPQYELLVADGIVSPAQADAYRAERAAAGLPMQPRDLAPRPGAGFEWLFAAGGPSVGDREIVTLGEEQWEARRHGDHDGTLSRSETRRSLPLDGLTPSQAVAAIADAPNDAAIREPSFYLHRELAKSDQGVRWSTAFLVAKGVYARPSGTGQDFASALAAVCAVHFDPVDIAGVPSYRDGGGDEWIAVAPDDGQALTLRRFKQPFDAARPWYWERSLDEASSAKAVASMFGAHHLSGYAATREDAMQAALGAPACLLSLAGQLLGDDRFEAGRQAGRAEVKAAVDQLFGNRA